jgi:hypothetical protein
VREVNRKVLVIAVALLAAAISASSIAQAFAETIFVEHSPVDGLTVIDIPGVTPEEGIKITFAHYDRKSDHGARDNIGVYLWTFIPGLGFGYLMVAWYSDTAEGVSYNEALMQPWPVWIEQLKGWQLNIGRFGRTAFALWTVPLEVPEINWFGVFTTPAVTIPPGCLILRGYGDLKTETFIMPSPSGLVAVGEAEVYDANGCFACPTWRYWGATTGTTSLGAVSWTTTGP